MGIYNWYENCEYILKTQQYTTNIKSFYEQIVFITYLRNQNKTKEEIYNIWQNTLSPQILILKEEESNIEISLVFKILWEKSEKCVVFKIKTFPIKIFKEEIDYINSLFCEHWFREYLLGLLFFHKFFNIDHLVLTKEINKDILHTINKKELNERQIKLANEYRKKYSLYTSKVHRINGKQERVMKINYCLTEGNIINTFKNPLEFKEIFNLLSEGTQTCETCRKTYEITSNNKKNLCLDCYKTSRQKYINDYKRQKRKLKKVTATGAKKLLLMKERDKNE